MIETFSSNALLFVKRPESDAMAMIDTAKLKARFLQAMADNPKVSQADIAEVCGVSAQAVYNWKNTGRIDKKHFSALSQLLNKPLEYWLGVGSIREPVRAYGIRAIDGADGFDDEKEVMIAEVDAELAAGDGQAIEFVETKYRLPYQIEWLRSVGVRDPADVVLMRVHGSSMERTIFDADKVLVHLKKTKVVSDAVFAIMLDGEPKVKRLFNTGDGVRIVSDNEDKVKYPDDLVTPDQEDRLIIIGRAIHKQGSKGL